MFSEERLFWILRENKRKTNLFLIDYKDDGCSLYEPVIRTSFGDSICRELFKPNGRF